MFTVGLSPSLVHPQLSFMMHHTHGGFRLGGVSMADVSLGCPHSLKQCSRYIRSSDFLQSQVFVPIGPPSLGGVSTFLHTPWPLALPAPGGWVGRDGHRPLSALASTPNQASLETEPLSPAGLEGHRGPSS